ncbi:MAG: NAD(P)H-hydrate epimerase [Gemmataceae bacterium]|nr:NAD(P)H-hydrate epimerase [Gemmataceae bacterium]
MPLTRAAVRELDRRAIEEFGLPGIVLMENAARNAAELLARLNPARERVAIACGPGNNGGDGYAMARHLDRLGQTAHVFAFAPPTAADAVTNYRVIDRMGLPITVGPAVPAFDRFGWIVDALFGTGLDRPLTSPFDAVVLAINSSGTKVLAIDVPSGLDADTGLPLGPCVHATHTLSLVGMKQGFLHNHARDYVGELHFADIGAPRRLVDQFLGA